MIDRGTTTSQRGIPAAAAQRGYSVPELMIAVVLLLLIGFATLGVLRGFSRALADRGTAEGGSLALDRELDAMRTDASSSYAVFVPSRDVFGNPNAPGADTAAPGVGHEVDFYAKNDRGVESFWAYAYDAAAHTLQRYDYAPNDAGRATTGVFDRTTGALDTAAHYPTIPNVLDFAAQTLSANQLSSSTNAFGKLVHDLVGQVGVAPAADPVGFVPTNGRARADLYGGNGSVQIQVRSNSGSRIIHLAAAVMPSGFTVHEYPAIRGVVYRLDEVHRFWFGLAQITHSGIYEQLLVSYAPRDPTSWRPWCDYEVYGSGTTGLRLGDPKTNYDPTDYHETMGGLYNAVSDGSAETLDPVAKCGSAVPGPNATFATPAPTAPVVVPTNPPCFLAGECWPDQAPPNWTPASPWPVTSPPPAWCATHAASPLCGGTGGTPQPVTEAPPRVTYETPEPAATTGDATP